MARTGARPGDWTVTPLPGQVSALAFTRRYAPPDFRHLQRGVVPEVMEDRWFIVWHDDALWVHRSATGVCFYRLRFAPADGGFVVTEALANRDPSQHTGTDDHDIGMLGFLLDSVLRDVPRRG